MIKATTILLADDIRQEDNGKSIIIGVYSGNILVDRFPADLKLAIWLELELTGKSISPVIDLELRLRMLNIDGKNQFESTEPIKIETPAIAVAALQESNSIRAGLRIKSVPLHAKSDGKMDISIRESNKRWKTILVKHISLRPATS